MQAVLCISLPDHIRFAVKCNHPAIYNICSFSETLIEDNRFPVIVIPVEMFIFRADLFQNMRVLSFGEPEYLEEAFLLGSFDYLKAPWTERELIHRLDKALSWQRVSSTFPPLEFLSNSVRIDGKSIALTQKEKGILFFLYTNRNTLCPYKSISGFIGIESENYEKTLFVYISRLKKKLKDSVPLLYPDVLNIRVIYREGYLLEIPCV